MTARILCYLLIYLAEAIITWQYFEHLFSRKRKPLMLMGCFAVFYSVLLCLFSVDTVVLNAVLYFTGNLILLFLNYRCSVKTAVLQTAFVCFVLLLTELLSSLLLSGLFQGFTAYRSNLSMLIAMAVISKLLYFAITTIFARVLSNQKDTEDEPKMMLLFCGVPVFSLLVALACVYLGFHFGFTQASEILVAVNMFILLAVNVAMMLLYQYLRKTNQEKTLLQLSLQKEQADMAYYHVLQEQTESMKILIHDFKNHIRTIGSLANECRNAEIVEYTAKLEESLPMKDSIRRSNDVILNLILHHTAEECKNEGIDFHCDVREGCVTFLDAPSKTALFDNLLSNAVEAAKDSEEREIDFSISRSLNQSSVIITLVNSCDTAPEVDGSGQYRSKKKDTIVHGVGMKSIARVVKKYGGVSTMYYDEKARKVHCVIRFSLQTIVTTK